MGWSAYSELHGLSDECAGHQRRYRLRAESALTLANDEVKQIELQLAQQARTTPR
jgi:hypothetical protein